MVHQPVPLLPSPSGFELCSDSKAFASPDSQYFPPSPISESGCQAKPMVEQSDHFDQYQQRRPSHENLDEACQRPSGLQIDFSEYDQRGRVEDEHIERMVVGEDHRVGGGGDHRVGGGEDHQVRGDFPPRRSPVDYPPPDYCTPLVIKVTLSQS